MDYNFQSKNHNRKLFLQTTVSCTKIYGERRKKKQHSIGNFISFNLIYFYFLRVRPLKTEIYKMVRQNTFF